MLLEYDPDADAIYISLGAKEVSVAKTVELDAERAVDYDDDGNPIGVEFLSVSLGVNVADLPRAEELCELLESVRRVPIAS